MKAVVRNGFGLSSVAVTDVEEAPFLPMSAEIKTKKVPLLPYDIMKINGEIYTDKQTTLGYGAVGVVTKVGALRSKKLIGQRVIVLDQNGTFKENIVSNMPPLIIPIPDEVANEEAVAVIGGVAYMLMKKIIRAATTTKQVVILGANSVVGISLIQLLKNKGNVTIIPEVRQESRDYFDRLVESLGMDAFLNTDKIMADALVVDIAGNKDLVSLYKNQGFEIISVVIQGVPGIKFVSAPLFPNEYALILGMMAQKKLRVFIDKDFSVNQIDEAINYQIMSYSRGRNVISFD
ncbi:zinc-binding alcohol dehydrogenase family protein [Weissella cibaria]|uniref:zinc-binding alcohol dehydrogenase family protein n=1 Tax=Weissella cibaria TaxID=137591 RepID=UPI0011944C7F|nr:zinc-binding alcohol dehydrogenase family protein [Weissella cibaria]TVV25554.1 zinc-binding alcohol dehydrogenase family protein [Weissella cibaria]